MAYLGLNPLLFRPLCLPRRSSASMTEQSLGSSRGEGTLGQTKRAQHNLGGHPKKVGPLGATTETGGGRTSPELFLLSHNDLWRLWRLFAGVSFFHSVSGGEKKHPSSLPKQTQKLPMAKVSFWAYEKVRLVAIFWHKCAKKNPGRWRPGPR